MIAERYDESLVAARHYLNWSLADVVYVYRRKTNAKHAASSSWPPAAVDRLRQKLTSLGEYKVYEEGVRSLDRQLYSLQAAGIGVLHEA